MTRKQWASFKNSESLLRCIVSPEVFKSPLVRGDFIKLKPKTHAC